MTAIALQALAAAAAGVLLFRLWQAALPPQPWLRRVVAAGFLVRAVGGQLCFWVSWARLPLLPQLQSGNGIWFFGIDGIGYFANAANAASEGLTAVARMPPSQPAVVYVQLLAVAAWLFGAVTSTGLMVNLFCYLGCVALLRRWTHDQDGGGEGAAIAIAAISVSPAFVLWSLQPLKDTFFQLLVVGFVCACAAWQRAWRREPLWRKVALPGALLVILLAALSGVRWYVACAVLVAALPFLLATALRAPRRKGLAIGAAAAVALLLSRALLAGGRGQIPQPVVALLTPATSFAAMANLPSTIGSHLTGARDAFDATGGRTVIQPPRRPGTTRPPAPPPAGGDEAQVRATVERIVDGWNRGDAEAIVASFDDTPDVEIWNDGKRTAAGAEEVREVYGALAASSAEESVAVADLRVAVDGGTATASGRWQRERRGRRHDGSVTFALRRTGSGWRVIKQTTSAAAPPAAGGGQAILPVPTDTIARSPVRTGRIAHPPQARVALGAAAMVVPRVAGEALGLFHVGGGRGFLWLTDLDTIVFDLALLAAVAVVAKRFRTARRDPLVWMLAALTLLIAVPLAYSVTNFGTLFRLRETVYLCVILLPAAAAAAAARDAPAGP